MPIPADLDWQSVSSSNVAEAAYEPDFERFWVRFKSGATYAYDGVSAETWRFFLVATSKGKFIFETIRNGGRDNLYAYRQVN